MTRFRAEQEATTDYLVALAQTIGITRDTMAYAYARSIHSGADIDWGAVNRAIIQRWSISALKYIKRKAFKE